MADGQYRILKVQLPLVGGLAAGGLNSPAMQRNGEFGSLDLVPIMFYES